jgi:XTP/dITP diphosphohydrolase
MRKIVLASNNKHKVCEIKTILNDVEILTLNDIGYFDDIDETGETLLENALIKAKTISMYLRDNGLEYDVLADDSGLFCIGLDLAPGVYSARYAGGHGDDAANRKKLLENIKGKNRDAYFECLMVIYYSDDTYEYKSGKTYGKIIDEELGDTSFGYDCIFKSIDLNKTFGEASSEEKNKVSHRYRALMQIKEIL